MAQNVIINGVTYRDVPEIKIPKSGESGTASFYDASAASAEDTDVLSGKTYFRSGGSHVGSMPNNGAISQTITAVSQIITIPAGYTSGGGVQINSTDQAKLIAGNIKSGVTILGVTGELTTPIVSQDSVTNVLSIS